MIFGPLGSLPLGGFPESVSVGTTPIHPASFFRKRGRKQDVPDRFIPPDWEVSLQKAREAKWLKRYEEAIRNAERDENLQKAWAALFQKFADEEQLRPLEEIKRTYFENIPPAIKARMMQTEQRVSAWKFVKEEEARIKKEKLAAENRMLALQMANDAKEREKERQEQIYKQRIKSLRKARRVKAKRNNQ